MGNSESARDKIEIKLEPRQVFILAAGTMVFSGLLFSAGFMLGRSAPMEANAVQPLPAEVIQGMTAAQQEGPHGLVHVCAVEVLNILLQAPTHKAKVLLDLLEDNLGKDVIDNQFIKEGYKKKNF